MNGRPFPDGFRWGTATAAHQIEGGNTNNDWWRWEHQPGSGVAEPSGDACDSWHRWSEDVAVIAGLGLDHYRFSVEWSRVEPAPGEWSSAARVPVGLTLSMTDYQPVDGGEARTEHTREVHEDVFLHATAGDDFLGVQTYTRMRIGPDGWAGPEPGVTVLPMGYEWWPQA